MLFDSSTVADDGVDEIASLVLRLHETQQRLQELAGGEVDAVVHPDGQSYLLHEAQEKLRGSEAAQRDVAATQSSILNALPAHIALLDERGAILSVNDGWRNFATANALLSSDFTVGRNYLRICDEARGDCSAEARAASAGIRTVLSGANAAFILEYPCHSPHEQRWYRLMVSPLVHRQAHGVVVMHVDITERKLAEEALRESEARFRGTCEQDAVGIGHVSTEGRFLRVNDKLCDIVGYGREELLGLTFSDLTLPEGRAKGLEARDSMLADKLSSVTTEKRYQRKDGEVVWINLVTTLERTAAGEAKYFISVFEEITGRKNAEERIAEQAALIDEARDAIVVRGLDHRIIFWSKGAERLYGWTSDEAKGSLLSELLVMDPVIFKEADRVVRETGAWNGEMIKTARNDTVLHLDSRWTLVRDAHGEPRSILSIDTDITERKRIELQFLRAQRMESIGTMAGGIAHDLNNSLAPIIMALDLLAAKFSDPDSAELLDIVSSSARRGADMVRQVLSFARGVEGKRQEVQIRHLGHDVEKIVHDTFPKDIHVRTNFANDLWTVSGDATQLHQVLLNLCVNARDAMPNGGTLAISAENLTVDEHYAGLNPEARPGPYVTIQVEDNGTGMPPEIVEKIFDPFFTTKAVGHGTGLGLATSLAIIKSHDGFIRVYSEPAKGTTFKFFLPAHTESSSIEAPELVVELPRGQGELILVVDDELSVRLITKQTLEAFGYRVALASDGAEAIAACVTRGAEIAVVLTDMMMPIMDGSATIKILRKLNPKLPIIAASGLFSSDHSSKFADLGIKHFLPKPYTAELLLKALKQILEGES